MGIYDQLNQLDKGRLPFPAQQTLDRSLNPDPDQAKPSTPSQTASSQQESQIARLPENKKASKQESQIARLPVDKIASKQENKKARLPESQPEKWLADLQPYLDLRAANKVSFRYPDTLIAWMEESLYRLKKTSGQKVTKNALLVAALAYVLGDLEQHGQESFLYQQFTQEQA